MNIAIFGGSFDPPHIGHEQIVNLLLQKLNIDRLFIVPTYLNPFKNKFHLKPQIRLELLQELFNHNSKIQICDFEIKQNRQVSSWETINYIKSNNNINKIYLVIGADNLKNLHLWYNFTNLKNLVEFVVISRNDYDIKNIYIDTINFHLDMDISSSKLRKNMDYNYIPSKIKQKVKQLWKQE